MTPPAVIPPRRLAIPAAVYSDDPGRKNILTIMTMNIITMNGVLILSMADVISGDEEKEKSG